METRGTPLRARLERGGLVGTWMMIPGLQLVEILGTAGFDFVILDLEHSAFGFDALPAMLAAAESAGIAAVVRVEEKGSRDIGKALDLGAAGVMVPGIETREDAEAAVRASKFHPVGRRGACPRVRAAGYGLARPADFYEAENRRRVTILLVESPTGMENLPEILDVGGVDALFFGFTDLSHAMGYPGQPDHPSVRGAVDAAIARTKGAGRFAGLSCYDEEEAGRRLAAGVDFVTVSGAEKLFLSACRHAIERIGARRAAGGR